LDFSYGTSLLSLDKKLHDFTIWVGITG